MSESPTLTSTTHEEPAADPRATRRFDRRQTLERAWRMRPFYVLLVPAVTPLVVFKYIPMYGVGIAFVDYNIVKGILGSTWNNFRWFSWVFNDYFFWRVLRNTVILSLLRLAIGLPAPIILALLLNEIRNAPYKRAVQSVSYLPHFLSWVVLGGLVRELLSMQTGTVPYLMALAGLEPISFLTNVPTFRALLVATGIWQGVGWGSIIYLASLSGIDPELYESASVDGANRMQMALRVTLPVPGPGHGDLLPRGSDRVKPYRVPRVPPAVGTTG